MIESLKSVRMEGHIAVIGVPPAKLSASVMIATAAKVQGLSLVPGKIFEAICRVLMLHRIRPVVDRVRPWTDARFPVKEMARGSHSARSC